MDLKNLYTVKRHDAGSEMRVKDDMGKDTDFYIKVVGLDSSKWSVIQANHLKDVAALKEGEQIDVEAARTKVLSQAIISWRGFNDGKKKVACTLKKAKELMEQAPYIKDQVDIFIANRANFTKG